MRPITILGLDVVHRWHLVEKRLVLFRFFDQTPSDLSNGDKAFSLFVLGSGKIGGGFYLVFPAGLSWPS